MGGSTQDGGGTRSGSPVATAMAVLRCFTAERPVLGVVEIADLVGLHKSSVSRMLSTLESEELVERDPYSSKYRLGLGLLQVAGAPLSDLDIRRAAAPVLAQVSEGTGETCSLLLWDGEAAVTVEQVPSRNPVKHAAELGTRYRTLASSSVRAFVREMEGSERAAALAALDADESMMAVLSRDDDELCTVNDGLTVPDEVGVAATVHDHRGDLVGVLLIASPRYRIDTEALTRLRRACAEGAQHVSERLGGTARRSS